MKPIAKRIAIASVVNFSLSKAHADWGINVLGRQSETRNYSYYDYVSIDRSQHIYVDTQPVSDALKKVADAIENNSTLRRLSPDDIRQLEKYYDLQKYGKVIGVSAGGGEAAAFVRKAGIDV